MGKSNFPISRKGWDWGDLVPGAFKLYHLQPTEPIQLWYFSNFCTFILGANSYYPSKEQIFHIFRKGQNRCPRPVAFKLDHLQPAKPILLWCFSNFGTCILGSQFLLPQARPNVRVRKSYNIIYLFFNLSLSICMRVFVNFIILA